MKIKNLTSVVQSLWIRDMLRGGSIQVQVLPTEPREIASHYIPDRSKTTDFDKRFQIILEGNITKTVSKVEDTSNEEVTNEVENEISNNQDVEDDEPTEQGVEPSNEETTEKEPEVSEDKFICDECGAEFASARGLASHKSRAHSEQ